MGGGHAVVGGLRGGGGRGVGGGEGFGDFRVGDLARAAEGEVGGVGAFAGSFEEVAVYDGDMALLLVDDVESTHIVVPGFPGESLVRDEAYPVESAEKTR